MEKFNLKTTRTNEIEVELDPDFFNENWFKNFRKYMYELYTLKELADHIAYNVVENGLWFIDGVGTPLRDGEIPICINKGDLEHLNKHVNIKYNNYDTEWKSEII